MEIIKTTLSELTRLIQKKELRALEVSEAFLSHARKLNPKLNAFISWNEKLLEDAKKIDGLIEKNADVGPLAGAPLAIKDLLCTKNLKTTAASKILSNFVPPYSATVVERLSKAGALIIGKTNLDEFAMGSSNEN